MRSRRFEWAVLLTGAAALLCLVWLAAKVTVGATMPFDETARAALHSTASPGLTRLFQSVTLLGGQLAVIAVSIGAALVLFLAAALLLSAPPARAQWTGDATVNTPVCVDPAVQMNSVAVTDGAGGVIVAWADNRNPASPADIYAQRFNASGVAQWAANSG
jgi:energy-converting hydrogenase Eha subunit A